MPKIIPITKNILVVAGDPSGDLHGANLIKALKEKDPELYVAALGGSGMQKVSDRFIYNVAEIGAAGFSAPLRHFFMWAKLIRLIRKFMEERRPACVIAIDFYGFNHQVLGLAAHRRIPAYYYVSPQVWASRPGRIESIARLVKHMLVILPFEADIYSQAKVPCTFVGHPLLDILPEPKTPSPGNGTAKSWKIGILPGSRPQEISRHLPLFMEAYYKIKESFPNATAHIFAVPGIKDKRIADLCGEKTPADDKSVMVVREENYSHRAEMDFCLTASGTATLENALLGLPMIVAYQMPRLTYEVAKRIVKVPYISMVNILSGRMIVQEFIQSEATSSRIAAKVMFYLQNPDKLAALRSELLALRHLFGNSGASSRAADIILKGL